MLILDAGATLAAGCGTATALTYTLFGMELAGSTETYKVLAQGQIAASAATLYTVPAVTTAFVERLFVSNTTASAVSATIFYVNGTTATHQITGSFTIPAGGNLTFDAMGWRVYDKNGNGQTTGTNIFDATAPGNVDPTVSGASGSATTAIRRDHTHRSTGGIASFPTPYQPGGGGQESSLMQVTMPANFAQAGSTYRFTAHFAGASSGTSGGSASFNIRFGGAFYLQGTIVVTTSPGNNSNKTGAIRVHGIVTVRTNGATGSVIGAIMCWNGDVTNGTFNVLNSLGVATATVALNTTVFRIFEFTVSPTATNSISIDVADTETVKV